ncbi:MAG: iron uptake porin [Cyanobacteria bacterium P01_C01_bin.72]
MNRLFLQAAKAAPVLFAATLFTANGASAQTVNQTLEQINNYQQLNVDQSQVTNVNQLRDVSPTDWAYEALRSLVDRYGCISGFPNQTYRGNQPLTRYEFAAGLNSCLNQIERLIASTSGGIDPDQLETMERLTQEFEAELATIGGRVDEIESRTAVLEDSQFSTTTQLKGEVIFALADAFGEFADGSGNDLDDQTTFSSRVRLNFDTSFFGKDRLRTRIQQGNFENIDDDVTGTDSTRLGFDTGSDVSISDLHYRFPFNDKIRVWVGGQGLDLDDILAVSNPVLDGGSTGFLSRFNRRDPVVLRGTEGTGVGVNIDVIEDRVAVNALYLADDASDPSEGEGLFNGSFSAAGQIVVNPIDNLEVSATYVRSYQSAGDVQITGGTGTDNSDDTPFGAGVDVAANRIGAGVNYSFGERIVVGGWGGYADVEGIVDGDNPSGDVWTWGANLAILDIGKEGAVLGVGGGQIPQFTTQDEGFEEDTDQSYIAEVIYKFPLNDSIAITPGVFAVFNPNSDTDNDTIFVGALRTTFRF